MSREDEKRKRQRERSATPRSGAWRSYPSGDQFGTGAGRTNDKKLLWPLVFYLNYVGIALLKGDAGSKSIKRAEPIRRW